jgi:O-antigen/teichoic acid export membrane protein
MSRMEAAGDFKSMMEMNARANAMVGMLLLPLLGFVFAFAEDLVSVVYTASYVDAAPVMRVYIVGMVALVVELSSVLQLLRQGMFSLGMNVAVLACAVPLSWFGGLELGLPGAAAGSVTALYLDRLIVLRRIAAISGVPVREQQHWRSFGRYLAWTAGTTLTAWLTVRYLFGDAPHVVRLIAGAATLGALYCAGNWKQFR